MRRLMLLFALLLIPAWAGAHDFIRYIPPAGGAGAAWNGGAFATPAEGPDGCVNPAYGFGATDTDAGFCLFGANDVRIGTSHAAGTLRAGAIFNPGGSQFGVVDGGDLLTGFFSLDDGANPESSVYVNGTKFVQWGPGNSFYLGSVLTGMTWEGATANDFETTWAVTDPTADNTITFPDATGDVAVIASAGFPVRTGSATWATRSFTSGDGSIVWTNPAGTGGNVDGTVDSSVFSRFSSGTGDASGACSPGTFHIRTDTDRAWFCTDTTPTWTPVATGAGSASGANTVDVTLAGTPDYITISGQQITRGTIDVADLSNGTDGNLITWDAAGAPAVVATGDAGQVLTSNGAGAAPTFQAAAGGSTFNPGTTFTIYEEFSAGYGNSAATNGTIGENGFSFGTSGGSAWNLVGTAANPGQYELTTSASDDGYAAVFPAERWGALNTQVWSYDTVIATGSTITDYGLYVGFADAYPSRIGFANYGIYARYDTDRGDSTWMFQLCDNAGANGCDEAGDATNSTVVASSITPSTSTRYRVRISQDFTGPGSSRKISMRINDEAAITFCSSTCSDVIDQAPTTQAIKPFFDLSTRTTAARTVALDYFYAVITLAAARY